MGMAFIRHWNVVNTKFWKERDHQEDVDVSRKIILKCILKGCELDLSGSG
jgi:hypothetical protein